MVRAYSTRNDSCASLLTWKILHICFIWKFFPDTNSYDMTLLCFLGRTIQVKSHLIAERLEENVLSDTFT